MPDLQFAFFPFNSLIEIHLILARPKRINHTGNMANLTLFEKLNQIESRYDEMTQQLSSAEVQAESGRYQKLAKTHAEMGEIVAKYREWKEIDKGLQGAKQLITNPTTPK